VYRNEGSGVFVDIRTRLPGAHYGSAAWGDHDNDGDLDLVVAGDTDAGAITRIYSNVGAPANTVPSAPPNLTAVIDGAEVTFSWEIAGDAETPPPGLTYNLRVGTTPGGHQISSAMADGASGYRRVAASGNAQQRTSWTLTLPGGSYYWSVQAVDGAWAGSPFAAEQVLNQTTTVAEKLPRELSFALVGANPGIGSASFRLSLPVATDVRLSIYDVAGRRVATLLDGEHPAGYHVIGWEPTASGVYFARVEANGRTLTERFVIFRP
jgi:hypothetical protein